MGQIELIPSKRIKFKKKFNNGNKNSNNQEHN